MNIRPFTLGDWFAIGKVNPSTQQARLPKVLIWGVWLICLLPFVLNLLGIDFGTQGITFDPANLGDRPLIDTLHKTLRGSFTHTILEWSAFCCAIFTTGLAFIHFRLQQDVTTPVIGVALLCAGLMDAFHTLAADRLIPVVADNTNLVPFTWALCRMANVLLTLVGVGIFLVLQPAKWQKSIYFIVGISALFGILSYTTIHICATSDVLPQTMFPEATITRPWDVTPLILFLFAGLVIYPRFNRFYPSIFSHSLIISTIPNVFTQAHMAFGSTALFDNHFNIAHFLKIIAYIVPLSGLVCDYYYTYRDLNHVNKRLNHTIQEQEETAAALRKSENLLLEKNQELEQAFISLQQTQTQLIQTEKMSSLGQMVAGIAHEINNPVNFIHGNVIHLQDHMQDIFDLLDLYAEEYPEESEAIADLMEDIDLEFLREDIPKMLGSMRMGSERIREMVLSLRNFSRLDEAELKLANLHDGIDSTLTILNNRIKKGIEVHKEYGDIPEIACYPAQLNQVWMNLISNAIDATESRLEGISGFLPELTIRTEKIDASHIQVTIQDNGCGLDEATKAKIFDPFFTTKPIGKGTGLGLAIAFQIVEKHNGKIEVNSVPQEGTSFHIQLPIQQLNVT